MNSDPEVAATTGTNNNNADKMLDPSTNRILNIAYVQGVLMETPSGYFKAMSWISDKRWRTHFISGEWYSLEYPGLRMVIDGIQAVKITFRAYSSDQRQERWGIGIAPAAVIVERRPPPDVGAPERVELSSPDTRSVFLLPADNWTDKNCGAQCRRTLETLQHNLTALLKDKKGDMSARELLLIHRLTHQLGIITGMIKPSAARKLMFPPIRRPNPET